VGCGPQTKQGLKGFNTDDWAEIRFDIDEKVKPDIVGMLTDMTAVPSGSMDAVFSSHNIEHLFAHEVIGALKEFNRVLKDDGFVVLTCPDLQSVCEAVANDKLLEPLYVSPAGPISPIDILYGHRGFIASGNEYMAHKCGFTYRVLDQSFQEAGFHNRAGLRRPEVFDLWMVAFKSQLNEPDIRSIASRYIA
jgi:SAM-dependent methyltransferase